MDSPLPGVPPRGDQKTIMGMDRSQESLFVSYFQSLPQKPSTTVRLFERERGEYFTAHGDDAVFAAKEVFRTTSVIKYIGDEKNPTQIPSVILSRPNMESLVKNLLLVKQYRVEFWKQAGGGGKGKSMKDWLIDAKASPGNMLAVEDLVFSGSNDLTSSMGVMALKPGSSGANKVIGVCYVDVTQRLLQVAEVVWVDPCPELEAILCQVGPKECLLPIAGDDVTAALKTMLERSGILVTELKASEFVSKDIVQDLTRLLKFRKAEVRDAGVRPEVGQAQAMGALAGVIRFLQLMSDEGNFSCFKLLTLSTAEYVRLDPSALTALKVLPGPSDRGANQSIFALLNKCRTAQGQRLLAQWLKQPLRDVNKLEERLTIVELLVADSTLRLSLRDEHLKMVPDFHRLTRRFLRKQANLQDCYRIYLCISRLPEMISMLESKDNSTLNSVFVDPFKEAINDFAKFQEMIESTMDLEAASNSEFRIKPDFDEELEAVFETLTSLESSMHEDLRYVANDLGLDAGKSIKLESNPQLGWFYRVTNKEEKSLRHNKRYSMLDATKGGVRFHSSKLRSLNDDHTQAKAEFEDKQKIIVDEIVQITGGYAEPLSRISSVFSTLDVLLSFALASLTAPVPYSRPRFDLENQSLELRKARHPCLEVQEGVNYIANDVVMKRGERQFLIMTGPNMGGKSTYLRSVGACCLMAQIGCFVPSESALVPLLDSILARVGAGDCALRGVSTFMAEMLDTAAILKSSTKDSLILIDELGRGTSTFDGFGLAWAIAHHIAVNIGSFCLFATHFHELTSLAEEVTSVKNLHVSAVTDQEQLILLYEVKEGVCDESFGIHVAEMVQLPERVIARAKTKAAELEGVASVGGVARKGDDSKEDLKKGEESVNAFLEESRVLFQEMEHEVETELGGEEKFMKRFEEIRERYKADPSFRQYLKI